MNAKSSVLDILALVILVLFAVSLITIAFSGPPAQVALPLVTLIGLFALTLALEAREASHPRERGSRLAALAVIVLCAGLALAGLFLMQYRWAGLALVIPWTAKRSLSLLRRAAP